MTFSGQAQQQDCGLTCKYYIPVILNNNKIINIVHYDQQISSVIVFQFYVTYIGSVLHFPFYHLLLMFSGTCMKMNDFSHAKLLM